MKTAVISGASSGIGEACARLLAGEGWKVIVTGRRRALLEKIASDIDGLALCIDVTVTSPADFKLVEECDLLVNCAGGAIGIDGVNTADADDWMNMFKVNVLGTLRVTQALLPKVIASQGCIINITSTAALDGYEGGGGYCAAKSAERALTQTLRLEMKGVPIRVTEVLPGMVHTAEFALNRFGGDSEKASAVYEGVDRPLVAKDVASVVSMIANLPAHLNIDEMVIRPVAQRAQHSLYRGDLGWKTSNDQSSSS